MLIPEEEPVQPAVLMFICPITQDKAEVITGKVIQVLGVLYLSVICPICRQHHYWEAIS